VIRRKGGKKGEERHRGGGGGEGEARERKRGRKRATLHRKGGGRKRREGDAIHIILSEGSGWEGKSDLLL